MKTNQIIKLREFLLKNNLKYTFLFLQKIYIFVFRKIHFLNLIFNIKKLLNSKKELLKYKNIHEWKECFIIWWAPSLKKIDLKRLNKKIIFTVNKWHLLRNLGIRKSNYHFFTDDFWYNEIKKEDLNFSKKYFYSKIIFPRNKNFSFFKSKISFNFQDNITKHVSNPWTIILPAIQIAKYMWFKTIYLIWVDLTFNRNTSHFYQESEWETFRTIDHSLSNKNNMLKGIQLFWKHLEKQWISLINAFKIIVSF